MRLSELTIRLYEPADRPAVLAVFDSNVPDYFTTAERTEFEAFIDDLPGWYFVLETPDSQLVACGGYAVVADQARADLCWGMVARPYHSRGIGKVLTELRLEQASKDPRVHHVILNTTQHTRAFYEKLGFVTERVTPDGFAPGLDRYDMRRDVGQT